MDPDHAQSVDQNRDELERDLRDFLFDADLNWLTPPPADAKVKRVRQRSRV